MQNPQHRLGLQMELWGMLQCEDVRDIAEKHYITIIISKYWSRLLF